MEDGTAVGATVDVVAVEDRSRVPIRYVKLAMAAVAMVVVAMAGINLLPAGEGVDRRPSATSPASSASPAASTSSSAYGSAEATPIANDESADLDPGTYSIPWPKGWMSLTVPAGWWPREEGSGISKTPGRLPSPSVPTLAVHNVTRVVKDHCPSSGTGKTFPYEEVGPTVDDLTTALVNLAEPQRSGPTDITLGGYPARRFVLTLSDEFLASCGEGRWLWENADRSLFGVLHRGTATIYVVDVNGDRLVITSSYRGASADDIAQLEAVVASIDIELWSSAVPRPPSLPGGVFPSEELAIGWNWMTVDRVPFSFRVPAPGWERFGNISINKSAVAGPDAEGIIYWTTVPDGGFADPCTRILGPTAGASAADVAAAVAKAPGTQLLAGPSDITVAGRPAKHVFVSVREDYGCDPGFFHGWEDVPGSAFWARTDVGDTIRVWIVDVDGTLLFIAGETRIDAGSSLEREIEQIVESIRLDSPFPAATPSSNQEYLAIAPGSYDVPWPQGWIRLTMPAGWISAEARWDACPWPPTTCVLPQAGTTITRYPLERGVPTLTLNLVHDVTDVATDVCAAPPGRRFEPVGPTVQDLATALANQVGLERTRPTSITLGGYPATRIAVTMPSPPERGCLEPEDRREIWWNTGAYGFEVPEGGTGTIYIVDVNGVRLVITSLARDASPEDVAQLDAIIASVQIVPSATPVPDRTTMFPPSGFLEIGRHTMTVAGVPLSFEVSTSGASATGWGSNGAFSIGKDIRGSQGAEAAILWTSFPDGAHPHLCSEVLGRDAGPSAAHLAAAVASAAVAADAIALTGPSDVTVGDRLAKRVVFTVGDDYGCQPGFFYTWPSIYGGPLWGETQRRDTISVWIVEVNGVLLFIEAITTTAATDNLEEEVRQIVDSIRFE